MRFHYMNYQRVGHLGYRLYYLGWHSGLHNTVPLLQHWLFSIFFYYRQGFAAGTAHIKEYRLERNLR